MTEAYYVGAYWGQRRESVEECAARAVALLTRLASCDELFARWFTLGRSRREALEHEVRPSQETLRELLLAGQSRRDIDRSVIDELGFGLSLWTGGKDGESANMSLSCGGYSTSVVNSCVVDLPDQGVVAERVLRVEVLARVVDAVARSLEPDWATVTSHEYRDSFAKAISRSPATPLVGWLLYLAAGRGTVPPLPSPSRVVPVGSYGNLVIVTDDLFASDRPDHVEAARRVAEALEGAGLLVPAR